MKRIALFVLTNLAIIVVLMLFLNIIGAVFGINFAGISGRQLDLGALAVFALVLGFAGSFLSLAISKPVAKWSTGARVIDRPANAMESWLVETVRAHAQKAGIGMPEVAVYDGAPNAFATGARKNSALVAVSTGLLQSMSKEEVDAVLGHEVAHVANGDMVTMALLQGVVNTFVIFLSRIVGHVVDRVVFKTERGYGPAYYITSILAQIVLGILASTIVMWFSRRREFRADQGGAALSARSKMIGALRALQRGQQPEDLPGEFAAFGISGGMGGGLKRLFLSHPPLEERIAALEANR
jgi:heat shock protein HtpX